MVKHAAHGYIREFIFWTTLVGPTHKTYDDPTLAALPVLSVTVSPSLFVLPHGPAIWKLLTITI